MKLKLIIPRLVVLLAAFAAGLYGVFMLSGAAFLASSPESETAAVRDFETENSHYLTADEDYAVFSAVLEQRLSARESFVVGETVFDANPGDVRQLNREFHDYPGTVRKFPDLSAAVVDDYLSRNEKPAKLKHRLTVKSPVIILSRSEEDDLFPKKGAGWDIFYGKYPQSGGIVYFSNVGFNAEKTEAVVRVRYHCGVCSGASAFYFLKRVENRWLVQQRSNDAF